MVRSYGAARWKSLAAMVVITVAGSLFVPAEVQADVPGGPAGRIAADEDVAIEQAQMPLLDAAEQIQSLASAFRYRPPTSWIKKERCLLGWEDRTC
jgi:hypothetical protein